MSVKAVALWDISEITLDIQGTNVILMEPVETNKFTNGMVAKAQVCLSLAQAKELLRTLHAAINTYEELDKISETV